MTPRPYCPSNRDEWYYLSTFTSELPDDDDLEEIGTVPEGIHFVRNLCFETLHLAALNSHIIANYRKDSTRFQCFRFSGCSYDSGSIWNGQIIFKYY